MNALDVKAGSDGFPAKDGTREVMKFGRYDKTEDFIGGGTNPRTTSSTRCWERARTARRLTRATP